MLSQQYGYCANIDNVSIFYSLVIHVSMTIRSFQRSEC